MLASAPAWAGPPRVALVDFRGPRSAKAKTIVTRIVAAKYQVVSAGRYADGAGLERKNAAEVVNIAAELKADALIAGTVKRRGARWLFILRVWEGASGRALDTVMVLLHTPRVDPHAENEIVRKLVPVIASIQARPDPESTEPADPGSPPADGEPAPGIDGVALPEPAATGLAKDDERTSAGPRWDHQNVGLETAGGIKFSRRSLSFTTKSTLTPSQQPPRYGGGLVPGPYVALGIYPFAVAGMDGLLAGLGIGFSFETWVRLNGIVTPHATYDMAGTSHSFPTRQTGWNVGTIYRWPLGRSATTPVLRLAGGYGRFSFRIDSGSTDVGLPDVDYRIVNIGAGVRLPVGTPRIRVVADGKLLLVSEVGAFSKMEHYGSGSTIGLEAELGLEVKVLERMVLSGGVGYQRFAFDFDGTGAATNRDSAPDQDVGGALDEYWSGQMTAGWMFW